MGIPVAFSSKISTIGNYFYYDLNGIKHISTFYYNTSSDFSQTLLGKILLGLTIFFLNFFLSLLAGIILNILSYVAYKSYLKKRSRRVANEFN